MSKEDAARFVAELVGSVQGSILGLIERGKLPEEWDGHELRQLLADWFANQVGRHVMTGKRLRAYKNDVLTGNLD